ncbi:MAG: protein kinase [Sandaracinus sp.]
MAGEHQYELLERIGVGGMAEVYRANALGAEGFERPIAIKRILPNLAEDEDFVKMFIDEAKIAVQLSHPNIVGIFDLGRFGDDYFIAMELVHGRDLRQIQDREAQLGRRLPIEIALHSAMKVCEALHHAHFKGGGGLMDDRVFIIHRDVSPQNVLVSYDGQVKVTDFGLAKAAGRAVQTQAGIIKGKLAYMSPEQLTSVTLDQRSDVFAAGTLLWEMLTGERLFLGKNDRETIQNVFQARVQSTRALDPAIPEDLDRVVMRALAKDRDQRYRTAQELHDDLEEAAYACNAMIGAPAVSAYMRALFPEAEVSGSVRRRDPRAATAEIRLSDVGGPGRSGAGALSPAPRGGVKSAMPDAEELDADELEDDDEPEEIDDFVEAEPDSIAPPGYEAPRYPSPLAELPDADPERDPEESRQTIPPIGLLDAATPAIPEPPPAMTEANRDPAPVTASLAFADLTPDPISALRATPVARDAPPTHGSGPRAVEPPAVAQIRPPPVVAPVHASFADDEGEGDRTMYGAPPAASFDATLDLAKATAEYRGELDAALAAMEGLESFDAGPEGRVLPEEMLTTKHHAPSTDLLARSRRDAPRLGGLPATPAEVPRAQPDTIPPPDAYDDHTVVGGSGTHAPEPGSFRANDWEDETTPIGGEARQRRR